MTKFIFNKNTYILSFILLIFSFFSFGQDPIQVGSGEGVAVDYKNPKKVQIGLIRIEGADNYDHQAIKLIAGLREGQILNIPGEEMSKAIRNLWKEELFSDVQIEIEKEIAGVVYLLIKLNPRPKLSRFKFVGVTKHEADKIREEISLYSGKTITENLVFLTESKIKGYYREKGFYSVQVQIDRIVDTLINNSEIFVIRIDKKDKVKIGILAIEGNTSIPTWKLEMAMKDTKEKRFWRFYKRSKFNLAAFERDKQALLNKYNAIGLRDAEIKFDTVYKMDDRNLAVKIVIAEGEKYYFGNIEWIGNSKFRSSFLDTILGIKKGDVYDKSLLDQRLNMSQDGRDISSLYMDRGYLFFQVIPVETNVDSNYINFQMRIMEGKEARVKRIIIKGNTRTNEYVIRREIRTKPGDLFSRNDIIRTQRELAQLGYFNEQGFQINPIPNPADGTVDIEYVVEEKSSDQIELSGGYGGQGVMGGSGLIGTLGLTFNNFSTKNFFQKGAWSPLPGGDGQRLSIRAQSTGRYMQAYNFSFTEPWLGGKKPNSLTYWFNHSALNTSGVLKSNPAYTGIGITGMGIGFGRRKKIPDDYFTAYYELSYQYYDVNNYGAGWPSFSTGYANDVSLKYVLQRNSISAPIYPQSGSNISLTMKSTLPYSLLGGETDFSNSTAQDRYKYLEYYKLKLTGEWFMPLTHDKKLVFRTKVGFAYLGAYNAAKGLIPSERFKLGGSGLSGMYQIGAQELIALRGYEDNSLSSAGGDPVCAKYTAEIRYPISLNPQATFYVLAFAEAGNTFPSFKSFNPLNVKRSAGLGIRVFLPMFGMLGLDYGLGFDKINAWGSGFNGPTNTDVNQRGFHPKFTFSIGMNLGEM
jgi:outer membrane protein insertion porin family